MKHAARLPALLVTTLLTGLAACDDFASPVRVPAYSFDLGGDVFRWPRDRLPVRYFADTRGPMGVLVADALARWEHQFLYGEFVGRRVADSTRADVIVLWRDSVPPVVTPDTAGAVGACTGVTSFPGVDEANAWIGPLRVHLLISPGFSTSQVAACLPRVTVHELGHTLGLLGHSPDPLDVMAGAPRTATPSARDRATVEVLYHTPPSIGPPPR